MGIAGIAFALAFFALLFLAMYRHPIFGLYAYMASYYIHPPSRWWGKALPDLRWALLAAAVTLFAIWLKREQFDKSRPSWNSTLPAKVLIFFTIWVWIQNLWALSADQHMELSVLYTKYILLYYLMYKLSETPEDVGRILFAHIVGCFYLGYVAFGTEFTDRLEGVGGPDINEANALGMQLATAVMCGSIFVLMERSWRWFVCAAAMPFVLNGMVLTGSRGAFLSVLLGGIVLWYMKPKKNKKLFYVLGLIGAIGFFAVANERFWSRMGTMEAAVDKQQTMDNSAESRFVIMKAQTLMAARYPWGTGHRGTEVLSQEFIPEQYLTVMPDGSIGARSSHNTFMTSLVEQGLPGAICFVLLFLWVIVSSLKLRKRFITGPPEAAAYVAAIAASFAVFYFAGIFVDYLKNEIQIWLLGALGALVAMKAVAPHGAKQSIASNKSEPASARVAR